MKLYQKLFKRIIDILISLLLLIIFSPIILILFILIRIKIGYPVFFLQERPGKNEKIFKMYKFRTMNDDKDENGNLLPDEERLTKFGLQLRVTSLDELPGLWNVLIGDMSLVGPRPLLVSYLPLYNEIQRKRHDVRPGLTGWAQVNGRNSLSWDEKFNLDKEYVENLSFFMDLKILFMTIYKVIKKDGITGENSATVEPFKGNEVKRKKNSNE
ncbi:sugar transferase [Aerococcus urinaeequi]|uniref:sugar transferase n=1 Tax=Aerococcus urinaeequi TaxID=51665 RepID=UPI0022E16805|nr:sugar transferase [Aerococcus urinaeequi]